MKRLPVFLCALALLLSLCLPAAAAPRYPAMNGMYTDAAGVLSSATLSDLRELQKKLDQEDALRLHIVTVDFLDGQDADAYVRELFTRWDLGNEDVLLLLAVGEDRYALHSGRDVQRRLPAAVTGKLLSAHLKTPFLAQEYDTAVQRFCLSLTTEVNKAYDADISCAGLFGQEEEGTLFDDWAGRLYSGVTQAVRGDNDSILTSEDRETGFSLIKVILIVGLLMLVFGRRRQKGRVFWMLLGAFGLYRLFKRR